MKPLLLALCLFPAIAFCQINRSATLLASENIEEYLVAKVFQGMTYKPVSFGELKACKDKGKEVYWTIDHRFEITEMERSGDRTISSRKPYRFSFYLDDKMKVKRAEAYYVAGSGTPGQ